MALADYSEYLTKLNARISADFQSTTTTGRASRMNALWPRFLPTPVTPTAAVITDSLSAESVGPVPGVGAGRLTVLGARMNTAGPAGVGVLLMDLLCINGGLSGVVTTTQTTNLPTPALTRYTSGEGVMAAIIIHTQIGTTATTAIVNYTNQAGVSKVSPSFPIGATGFREAQALILVPLADGDTGVRSIESVVLVGTTGTAGNFGVCLFKPLQLMALNDVESAIPLDAVTSGGVVGALPEVLDNACLTVATIATTLQNVNGVILLGEV